MIPVAAWMSRRFIRYKLWIPGCLLPAAIFLTAALREGETVEFAAGVMLGLLLYLIPALAAIFVLTSVDRARWDLLVTRPITFPGLLLGIWTGAAVPCLICQLALMALAWGTIQPRARDLPRSLSYYPGVALQRGAPGAEVPPPRGGAAERIAWIQRTDPWTFEARSIGAPRDLEARLLAEVGRPLAEAGPDGELRPARRLIQAEYVLATVSFPGPGGRERAPPMRIELRDREPTPITIPAEAVAENGSLTVVVAREEQPRDDGHTEHGLGPACFWFDRSRDDNLVFRGGLLVVRSSTGYGENFLRAGLMAPGLLLLYAAAATLAAALLGPAVAFAFCVTIFLFGSAMPFLRESASTLTIQSSVLLLGDPAQPSINRKPAWFDIALERFLNFWMTVLPDFRHFRGAEFLARGETIQWPTVAGGYGYALLYAGIFMVAALLLLRRWEVTR